MFQEPELIHGGFMSPRFVSKTCYFDHGALYNIVSTKATAQAGKQYLLEIPVIVHS